MNRPLLRLASTLLRGRLRADLSILISAVATIVLAATLLAAGPIYADAVYTAGARSTLASAASDEAGIDVRTTARREDYAAIDAAVTPILMQALAPTDGSVVRFGRTDSYALPGQLEQGHVRDLTVFMFADGLQQQAALVDGRWAEPHDADIIEAVVSDSAAGWLGLSIGDVLAVTGRRDNHAVTVSVVGIYRVSDARSPFWSDDALLLTGRSDGEAFTTYGPFIVAQPVFFEVFATRPLTVRWWALPTAASATAASLPHVRERVLAVPGRIAGVQSVDELTVTTRLPHLLSTIERSLLTTRAGVQIMAFQLALLAGYALMLTAGQLADRRATETALLRARGASTRQLAALSLVEGLLLALPAVVLGPLLAVQLLRLLNSVGPLAGLGVALDPQLHRQAFVLAALGGLVSVLILLLAATAAARTALQVRRERGRARQRGVVARLRLDLLLAVVAVLGYLQLRQYRQPLTTSIEGTVDVDPLLVLAPGLGLLAGAVIALRGAPLLLHLIEQVATRSRNIAVVLGSWQVARRPARFARTALLLVLAGGLGLFATTYAWTWRSSQVDQAAFQVGADVRLEPSRRQGMPPDLLLANAYLQISGVQASMPVDVRVQQLSPVTGSVQTILLDADDAAQIVTFRDDLADADISTLMQGLRGARPEVPGIALPGAPRRLELELAVTLQPRCETDEKVATAEVTGCRVIRTDWPGQEQQYRAPVTPAIVVRDADGQFHRLRGAPLATVPDPDDPAYDPTAPQRLVFSLAGDAATGDMHARFPLQLVAIELDLLAPSFVQREGTFTLSAVRVSDSLAGDDWQPVDLSALASPDAWEAGATRMPLSVGVAPQAAVVPVVASASGVVTLQFDTGNAVDASTLQTSVSLRLVGYQPPDSVPVIVSESLLTATGLRVGDQFEGAFGLRERTLTIIDVVTGFPGSDPEQPVLIADLETIVSESLIEPGSWPATAGERWLGVSGDQIETVSATLAAAPFESVRLESRLARSEQLRTDPIALGTIGVLSIGFCAALVVAVIGFIQSMLASIRERATELGLLRAIGMSNRQLAAWLVLENGYLTVVGLTLGTVLGVTLAWAILPLISLNQIGAAVFPHVVVTIPWAQLLLVQGSLLAILVLSCLPVVLLLRRRGLGQVLRMGED